ncbi:nuclear transport factor 2 family protein [Pseudopedobacter sp.]|uniref:nuclear transport factor 2 family protein n=1 Tax=Pseudopedobacter sp. TaxID=1936787 RepID=UPI003340B0A8
MEATDFTTEWINAWNSHDLNTIMSHYSENIDFASPVIQQMGVDTAGKISNKADLREYFSKALQKYPELHFEFYHELKGVDSLVLFYKSVNDTLSAEYMELDTQEKICKVRAHYKNR